MKSIFESTQPRDEVLRGALSDDMFAARLRDVMEQSADDIYKNPERFFANTYPTAGLKTLLGEVLGRLTGYAPTNSPIIRLETSFGGGKTHNLIALYHAANGHIPKEVLGNYELNPEQVPHPGDVDVAGVVGSDLDPSNGMPHPEDSVTTYTLWGELAYQLGGRLGYELARESDENRAAPGAVLFDRIIGERPTLIMIDEIARHLRSATAVPTITGESTLAEQSVAFLMSLMEYVASKQQVVLVLTMASDQDAFAQETTALQSALAEASAVSARQERVLTPTGENEISAIVVHRLFKEIDRNAAKQTIARYGEYYHALQEQDAPIHERAGRADYLQEFEVSYPFHPELIRVLNLKVGTIPNFQRTRGALRLLANVVRELWQDRPAQTWLIHTHHVDLAKQPIIEDLTSRLDRPKFKQVCEADIVSPQIGIPAHAEEVDRPLVASGKPPYAQRQSATIFLHSLTQGIATGVELSELLLATITPTATSGDDPAVMRSTLERLYENAWFLEYDGFRYRFKTEPSLNKIIADEMASVRPTRAKQEIEERVRKIWRAGFLKPVYFPNSPADIDDDSGKPKLAIMHFDAVQINTETEAPPDLVRKLYEYSGVAESFRNFPNNVLFLVADDGQVDNMIAVARRYLATNRITGSAERMREFHKEHQKELRKMREASELDVRVAITKAYRHLLYPSSDAPKKSSYLRRETMPPQDQGETDKDQTNVVVRVLRNQQRVLTADDNPLPAQYIKSKAWDKNQVEMTTEDLRRAFARKISLPILLDVNQLKRSIEHGVKARTWIYYSTVEDFAYDHESPPTHWQISDDARLYEPAEATRLKLRIKGKWTPTREKGGEPEDGFEDEPPEEELDRILGTGRPSRIRGSGVPNQAFQQLLDQAQEHEVEAYRRMEIGFRGAEKSRATDLTAIGLAIPQMGKGVFGIKLNLVAQFGAGDSESTTIRYQGSWNRYKRLKQIGDAFAKEAQHLNLDFRLIIDFDGELAPTDRQIGAIRDILVSLGMGTIEVAAEPVYGETTA